MPPETHFFESLLAASGRIRFGPDAGASVAITEDEHRRWNDFGLTEDELLDRFEAIPRFNAPDALRAFYGLYAEKQGKPRWGDKTPTYVKTMRRIKRVLPEARFIHVIRDGRDVTLSNNKRMIERGHREPVPAERSAARWRKQDREAPARTARTWASTSRSATRTSSLTRSRRFARSASSSSSTSTR